MQRETGNVSVGERGVKDRPHKEGFATAETSHPMKASKRRITLAVFCHVRQGQARDTHFLQVNMGFIPSSPIKAIHYGSLIGGGSPASEAGPSHSSSLADHTEYVLFVQVLP